MGYTLDRFKSMIDDELKCPLCCGVLQDPIQSQKCEHAFCQKCINEWLKNSKTCPIDENSLCSEQLEPIPRIVRNIINHLKVKCDFSAEGCNSIVNLEDLETHKKTCSFNSEISIPCEKKCGAMMTKSKLKSHDCIQDLKELILEQRKEIQKLRNLLASLINTIEEQKQILIQNNSSLIDLSFRYQSSKKIVLNLEKSIHEIVQLADKQESSLQIQAQNLREKITQETTLEIYISNVDRYVSTSFLSQFLNHHSINVISCKESLNHGWKIDFRVIIFKSDYHKILSPKLWPKGVTCFVCGEYYSTKIEGDRELNQAGFNSMLKVFVEP